MSGTLNLLADGLAAGTDQLVLSGGNVGIGTAAPADKLDVATAPLNTYGTGLPSDAYQNPCEHRIGSCDGNHVAEYACRAGQPLSCEDIRNSDGEDWEYRAVRCNQAQTAAKFTGDVRRTGGTLTANGAGVTNVNADLLDGQHSSGIIAAASDGIPPSWHKIIPAAQRFVLVMGGAAVLDKETGLVWEKVPAGVPGTWSAMNIS